MALRLTLCTGLLLAASFSQAADEAMVAGAEPQAVASVSAPAAHNPDPWEKFNRGVHRFNDVADRYFLRPVAKGYKAVTPDPVRRGVTNFFSNLRSPIVVLNDVLQGKFKQAGGDTARFVLNSTVGVVGIFDVATRVNLPVHDEDFGQTLGVWGVPSGPYLVLPFMGPSSARDAVGFGGDVAANPRRYLLEDNVDWALTAVDVVNGRASLLDLEDIIQGDRYLFIRDLYLQRREYAVNDGQVQNDPFLDDEFEDEGMDATDAPDDAPDDAVDAPTSDAEPTDDPAEEPGAGVAPEQPSPLAEVANPAALTELSPEADGSVESLPEQALPVSVN